MYVYADIFALSFFGGVFLADGFDGFGFWGFFGGVFWVFFVRILALEIQGV